MRTTRYSRLSRQDGKLLTKREVLEHEIGQVQTAAEQKREQVLQHLHVDEDYHHEPQKSTLTGRTEFVRATGAWDAGP